MRRDQDIAKAIHDIDLDTKDIKSTQFVGYDSTQAYRVETDDVWDFDFTTASGSQLLDWETRYTGLSQSAPFCHVYLVCLINNTDFYRIPGNEFTGDEIWIAIRYIGAPGLFGGSTPPILAPNEKIWYQRIWIPDAGTNIKIKMYVMSTDTGTLDIGAMT